MKLLFLVLLSVSFAAGIDEAKDGELVRGFLEVYCIKCHGSEKQKGDRRFDHLSGKAEDLSQAESLQEILDQLNLAEMPPESEKQPTEEKTREVVSFLTKVLDQAREDARENRGKVVLRRLNRVEYLNTIRDLFDLKMVDFDPTTTFPPDEPTEGFDNVGEGLVASSHLLENYLEAARKVADKVIRPGPEPKMIHYQAGVEINPNGGMGEAGSDKVARREAGRIFIKFRQPLGFPALDKKRGVPADGEYLIRFSAKAVRRKSRYKDSDLRYNSDEPMRLSISIDSRELGATAHRIIGEYEIPDDELIEVEHRVWLEKGFTFHLHWANGPNGSFKRIMRKVLPKYNKDALYPARNPPEMYIGSGPELHVHSFEIEGPFFDQWPPTGFARYFPNPPPDPGSEYLDASLIRLANQAFRRPVSPDELKPYLKLASQYLLAKKDFWDAAHYGVRAILTSPRFLYLAESDPGKDPSALDPYELASRLSYFLWSSMPDRELREAAASGRLLETDELLSQAKRMLRDPRARALAENFAGQWLHLRKLGEMPPDPEKNKAYYSNNLEQAMREETGRFFNYVLSENRSILEFIDSDYTFLNESLAQHYGIEGVLGKTFTKVTLRPEHNRGGLLGHGSVLTATSNGVETQPVLRGVWVLENLLGTPPNSPPPDVEPIEPDTRGVSTMRELMEKHRNNPTCFECHRKIDPLGLSMEHYDHVGAWRERYAKRLPIDGSGEMPDGTTIEGPSGIKAYLKGRPGQFTHCLTEKLFVYALGRRLSFTDRDDLDAIVTLMPKLGYGLQELILQIVASEPFRFK